MCKSNEKSNAAIIPALKEDRLMVPRYPFKVSLQGFIGTIPPLIHALDAVKDTVQKQRKITQAFGEAFDLCEACG